MLRDMRLSQAMVLQNRQDVAIRPIPAAVLAALYDGDGEHFMVEAVDMADIESTYFYDAPLMPEINAVMLEAVTSTRARLSGTMRAFIRALNQSLSGTGITAGNDSSGTADDGSQAMGGANIGRVRKVQGLAVMPAIIPLSDGQTVTLVFHSPTGNAATIAANDTLVAFQFLLNKKDVTHVVSPSNGRDISLKVVTTALSNLIERNTAKFQHAQAKQKAMKAEIASLQDEGNSLEEKQAALVEQGDALQTSINQDSVTLSDLSHKADQQEELNAELQAQVDAAQQKKDAAADEKVQDRQARAGALEAIQAKSGYKDTYVANWAFNQNIPTADLVDLASRLNSVDVQDLKDLIMYKGQVSDLSDLAALKARFGKPESDDPGPRTLYWYGLRARAAGPGAIPADPKPAVIATPDEAADIPVVKAKEFDPSYYRHGAVAYAYPLDAAAVDQYELTDFQRMQTPSSYSALLNDLIPLIQAYPGNENQFYLDYLNKDAPKANDLPQSMKDAGGFETIRQTMGSQATLKFIEFFKQVRKDTPAPPPAPVDDKPKPGDASGVQLTDGDTVPLESIQTGAMMPTIAKAATGGDNPIWYTQSTLNDIVASARLKINGQPASSNPEYAEALYQTVKAAMAAGFGMQRFKISGLQYIYVLRKDDDILTAQGAAKFKPPVAVPPPAETDPVPPVPDTAAGGNNGYVSVKPTADDAGSIASQVSALGITGGIAPEKLHVTLMYSKAHSVNIQPEPDRVYQATLTGQFKLLGADSALVALIDSPDLQKRFDELSAAGGVHSFPDYLPHISLKYGATEADLALIEGKGLDMASLKLTGETFKPVDDEPAKPAPQPDPAPVTPPKDELSPFMKAVEQLASLTGRDADAVARWAEVQNVPDDELTTFAAALAANPSPDNLSAVNNAFDFGSKIPALKEATAVDDANKPDPEKPEADAAAQQAIDYLKQVAEMQSSDLLEIRTARGNVRQAIAALTAAGVYEENEELVNAAAQHLADLLAAVAQKGAA